MAAHKEAQALIRIKIREQTPAVPYSVIGPLLSFSYEKRDAGKTSVLELQPGACFYPQKLDEV